MAGLLLLAGLAATSCVYFFPWKLTQSRRWVPTPCRIVETEIVQVPEGFRESVKYVYDYEGKTYQSQPTGKGNSTISDDYAFLMELKENHPPNTRGTCSVNPKNPTESAIIHPSLGMLHLSAGLVWVGLILFYVWLWIHFWTKDDNSRRLAQKIHRKDQMFGFALTGITGIVILYFLAPLLLNRVFYVYWTKTPCHVVFSGVRPNGKAHVPEIVYEYLYEGKTYRSNDLNGMPRGMEQAEAAKWAGQYNKGARRECYVNPLNPREAILTLDYDKLFLIPMLIAILMIIVGFTGTKYNRRKLREIG